MEIPTPACALVRNDTLFGARAHLCKFQFVAPKNDTERVRAEATTNQVRHGLAAGHDLAARPAGKFQFAVSLEFSQSTFHTVKTGSLAPRDAFPGGIFFPGIPRVRTPKKEVPP